MLSDNVIILYMPQETYGLDYPADMGDRQRKRIAMNGIDLVERSGKGLTALRTHFTLRPEDFASLSSKDLYDLIPHLQDTPYKKAMDEAMRMQDLIRQAKSFPEPGFYAPGESRPFTWPLRESLPGEIDNQLHELKEFGIESVMVGLELEFVCPEEAVLGFHKAEEVKRKVLLELSEEIKKTGDEFRLSELLTRYEEIEKFNDREMMMFDLVELDPIARDLVEPVFGRGHGGKGYYDNVDVLELRMKMGEISGVEGKRRQLTERIFAKATEYGLVIKNSPCVHVNVSFWDKDGNVFASDHPHFADTGKRICEGMALAFFEALPVIVNESYLEYDDVKDLRLGISRNDNLRYSTNRVEVRPSARGDVQDVQMMMSLCLAGALWGLRNPDSREMKKADLVVSPNILCDSERYDVLIDILHGASITPDGHFLFDESYVRNVGDKLNWELGITNRPPKATIVSSLFGNNFTDSEFTGLHNFLKEIRVLRDGGNGYKLLFPETSPGKFEVHIPGINWEALPKGLQQLILSGKKPSHSEISKYIKPGDLVPKPPRKVMIDVDGLRRSLRCVGVVSRWSVPGYDLNQPYGVDENGQQKLFVSRIQRMKDSRVIAKAFTPETRNTLITLTDGIGNKKATAEDTKLSFASVGEMLLDKVADNDFVVRKDRDGTTTEIIFQMRSGQEDFANNLRAQVKDILAKWGIDLHFSIFTNGINGGHQVNLWADPKLILLILEEIKEKAGKN